MTIEIAPVWIWIIGTILVIHIINGILKLVLVLVKRSIGKQMRQFHEHEMEKEQHIINSVKPHNKVIK